jgi:hypothetical protein
MYSGARGLVTVPKSEVSLDPENAKLSMLSFPVIVAPASRRRVTIVASISGL